MMNPMMQLMFTGYRHMRSSLDSANDGCGICPIPKNEERLFRRRHYCVIVIENKISCYHVELRNVALMIFLLGALSNGICSSFAAALKSMEKIIQLLSSSVRSFY